ncbi:MAG: NAD(P)-dependent oxidoreductase, partial [Stellaceae bacterium]
MQDRTAANIKRLAYFEQFFDAIAERTLAERPDIDLVRLHYDRPEAETWAELSRAHGYHIKPRGELRAPWFGDAALLSRCPSLLAICSSGAGYDMVDVAACTAAGVIVCNQSGFNKEAVAEHALGFMLALSKKIGIADRTLRRENVTDRWRFQGNDIRGKTVGIVGIGEIGTRTAELCRTLFGMTVLAYNTYLTKEQIAERGGTKVELDELMRRSDFVSVHCPRNAET